MKDKKYNKVIIVNDANEWVFTSLSKCSLKEAIEEYKNEECSEFPYNGEEFEYFVFGITEEKDEDSFGAD